MAFSACWMLSVFWLHWGTGDLSIPGWHWQAVSLCYRRGWINTSHYALALISLTQQPNFLCWFQSHTTNCKIFSLFLLDHFSRARVNAASLQACPEIPHGWAIRAEMLAGALPQPAPSGTTAPSSLSQRKEGEGGLQGILNVLWCQLVVKIVFADSVPERDAEAGLPSSCTCWGTESAPRDSQASEHFCSVALGI